MTKVCKKTNCEGANDITSLCISQDPLLLNVCVCTCYHDTNIVRAHVAFFLKSQGITWQVMMWNKLCHTYIVHTQPKNLFVENVINFSWNPPCHPRLYLHQQNLLRAWDAYLAVELLVVKCTFLDQTQYGDNPLCSWGYAKENRRSQGICVLQVPWCNVRKFIGTLSSVYQKYCKNKFCCF